MARDLAARMERLERETNYCIAENIRERLKFSKDISTIGGGNLISADDDVVEEE